MTTHTNLAAGRWATLLLAEQLANVGSEVDRAITAWAAQRVDRFDRALARARPTIAQACSTLNACVHSLRRKPGMHQRMHSGSIARAASTPPRSSFSDPN